MSIPVEVIHRASANRFESGVEPEIAVCDYELVGDRMIFTHTGVPPALRGRGVAEQLVRAALAEARTQGRKVVPRCSYVARFIEQHSEYRDLLEP